MGKPTENIDAYMRSIKGLPRVTPREEAELAHIIAGEDKDAALRARTRLIEANVSLVVKIAHDFKNCGLPFDDLVAEGNIGLMHAVDKFDPSKGAKFSCYASWWIKQAMRKALATDSRTIRIPVGSAQKVLRIDRETRSFEAMHGRKPSTAELAKLTGYSTQSITGLASAITSVCSLDALVKDSSQTQFDEIYAYETPEDDDRKEREYLLSRALKYADKCSDRDRYIIGSLFGLAGHSQLGIGMLSQETGLSKDEIEVRTHRLLKAMRAYCVE